MILCESCEQTLATSQVTIEDEEQHVYFVCEGCRPEDDIIHRVDFITANDFDIELEALLAREKGA